MAESSPTGVLAALTGDLRLRVFVRNGQIHTMPARRNRRLLLLNAIAQAFEPGVRYPESEVNEILSAVYPDCAGLRRYLVDEQMLDRANGEYWRVGGDVQV